MKISNKLNLHVASRPFFNGDSLDFKGGFEVGAPPAADPSLLWATMMRLEAEPDLSRRIFLAGLLDFIPEEIEVIDLL